MAQIQIELLGAFRLRDGAGREIPLRSPKHRGLVAYLALHRDQPIKRETLAGLLWGDSSDVQARQSLRQALLALRKTLGEAATALSADDVTVSLRGDYARTDVADFEAAVAEGRLEDAVAAYRGDLIEEPSARSDSFEDWLGQERVRLRDIACTSLETLIERMLSDGESDSAVQAGRQLNALDPWRESGSRLLMKSYAQAGRRAEALQHYRGLAEMLEQELDAEPDGETTRLFEAIRSGSYPLTKTLESGDGDEFSSDPPEISQVRPHTPDRRPWSKHLGALAVVIVAVVIGLSAVDHYLVRPPKRPKRCLTPSAYRPRPTSRRLRSFPS